MKDKFPFSSCNVSVSVPFFPSSSTCPSDNTSPILILLSPYTSVSLEVPCDSIPTNTSKLDNVSQVPLAPVIPISSQSTRPSRVKSVPQKFIDYIGLPTTFSKPVSSSELFAGTVSYPIHIYYSHHAFTPAYTKYLISTANVPTPYTYYQVIKYHVWCEAMKAEISDLESNNTWELVMMPANTNTVDCKWI